MLEYITLPNQELPPLGPFCHAVRAGDLLFVTGQLAEDPATGAMAIGPIDQQVRQVMENLKLVLTYAGSGFDRIVMSRVFITDMRYLQTVNEIYASYFPATRPARTTIGVMGLAGLGDVEIDLIAYCGT